MMVVPVPLKSATSILDEYIPVLCDDNDACTDDICDDQNGCYFPAVDCDDSDACTEDSCDSDTGCTHTTVV